MKLAVGAVLALAIVGAYLVGCYAGDGSRVFASPAVDNNRPFYVTQDASSIVLWRIENDRVVDATHYTLTQEPKVGQDGKAQEAAHFVDSTSYRPRPKQ